MCGPVGHTITLDKWDAFSCPPGIYRGFRNAYGDGVVEAFRKLFQLFRFDPPCDLGI